MTMPTTKTTSPAVASLNLPKPVPALIQYAQGIVTGMTGNPAFPNPTPSLAEITATIAALSLAENEAATRVKGAATSRNVVRATLVTQLKQLRSHVQTVADGDPEHSAAIIESARMGVRRTPVRPPRVFAATQGPTSGTAKLVAASAGHRAAYEWEYSVDGGHTWIAAPPSLQARTTVIGLPAGTAVQFRYRAVTRTGGGDWSDTVTLLVK